MTDPSPGYQRFFAELKRRRVFRVMAVYGIVAFVILQVADIALPGLGLPEWTITLILVLTLLGFPVAIVLAWAFDLTPEGVQRTAEAAPGELTEIIAAPASKRWPIGLAAAAGTALVLVGGWLALGRPGGTPPASDPAFLVQGSAPVAAHAESAAASIAVLPFADMSEAGDKEYFSDGLAEELIDALARVEGLRVAARTSSFAFKGGGADVRAIADSLGVQTVLEGSVRASGDRLRITAQLIQASDGFHLWNETYDRELTDLFAVQEEIADAIADALLGTLGLEHGDSLSVQRTDLAAYEQYLLGRAFVSQRGETLRRAEEHFRAALAIDSTYAPAWGGLAEVYAVYPYYVEFDITEALAQSEAAARRALALDSTSASARVALGSVLRERHQWEAAERELLRALELAPESSEAHGEYSQYLAYLGRVEEALVEAERALELDPLSNQKLGMSGFYAILAGREEEGMERMWRARGFTIATILLAQHLVYRGRFDEAERAARLDPEVDDLLLTLVEAARSAAGSPARERGLELVAGPGFLPMGKGGGTAQPAWLIYLDGPDAALDMLEELFSSPMMGLETLWMPMYDPIRDHPRFRAILAALGIPR
jgi:TolB-like protein